MIENLPSIISTAFILTTFASVGIFLYAVKKSVFDGFAAKLLSFLIAFWIFFQAFAAMSGFYLKTDNAPPRIVLFSAAPTIVLIILYFIFARRNFIEKLPLKILTILHVVRIPVEIVLYWLFEQKLVPQAMTFAGVNFDILAGITAPLAAWFAFKNNRVNRPFLIVWNMLALGLLINVVARAALALPSPLQQIAFDEPNRAVLYFPFAWLPTLVVPIVLFAHLVSLWQLFKRQEQ